MERRNVGLVLGLLVGLLLGSAVGLSFHGAASAARDSGARASQEEATRDFLRVPAGEIHLRALPRTAVRTHDGDAYLGMRKSDEDALHEFFREDTRRWFVDVVEVAVGSKGTLTMEVVDRPAPDGTPRASLARLVLEVEPGAGILVGMGVEGVGERTIIAPTSRTLMPDWAVNERQETGLDLSRLPSLRVRLVGAGGRARDATAAVASRDYTRPSLRSAWGSTNTMDQSLPPEVRSALDGLTFDWVPGTVHRGGDQSQVLVRPVGGFVTLGALFWSPTTDTATFRSSDSRSSAEHVLGPVTVTMTGEQVAVAVEGRPTALNVSPYPLWVSRLRFEPAGQSGK